MSEPPRRPGVLRTYLLRRRPIAALVPAGVVLILLIALTGCNGPAGVAIRPHDAREALARVNDNLGEVSGPVYCKPCLVSFKCRDADGRVHRFIGHPATIIFEPPRCLYFDIKHTLGGSVARVGSNDERFWVWIEPEVNKLWWGTWEALEAGTGKRFLVPPDQLLDVLMLRPLAETRANGLRPLLDLAGDRHRLLYVRLAGNGWPYVAREVTLDPRPPYQPIEIVDRLADGRTVLHARLGHYRPMGRGGPYTPRRYVIEWPLDDAELRIDIEDAKLRPEQLPFCEFPGDWAGTVEPLDPPSVDSTGGQNAEAPR